MVIDCIISKKSRICCFCENKSIFLKWYCKRWKFVIKYIVGHSAIQKEGERIMKRITALMLIVVLCMGLFSCMPNLRKYIAVDANDPIDFDPSTIEDENYNKFLRKINGLAMDLSYSISKTRENGENFVISPAAVYISLAAACESAKGETREQILSALGMTYEEVIEYTKYYYSLCNKEFTYIDTYKSERVSAHERLVSSVWINSSIEIDHDAAHSLGRNVFCSSYSINFSDKRANKIINQYVPYVSHNVLTDNVKIDNEADLAFIGVYHLKEIWNELGRSLTASLDEYTFTNADQTKVDKQLLKGTYEGGEVYSTNKYRSFYIKTDHGYRLHFIIPKKNFTLSDVFTPSIISKILSISDYGFINDITKTINYTRIIFPEIDIYFNEDISQSLKDDFNITDLFDSEKCDLSGLISGDAHLGSFVHLARMRLGTRGIEGESINMPESTKTPEKLPDYEVVYEDFVIDGAFGFVLTDPYGAILYIGELNTLK